MSMSISDEELTQLSATEIGIGLRAQTWSARDIVEAHLERIEKVNPLINAIVTLTPELALEQAATVDQLVKTGKPIGLLAGVPIAYKDTHDVAGVRTTYGSPIFADHVPATSELQVQRIADAGAICLGKTNVPEFAAGANTFNSVFGETRNPYDTSLSAGGSTGGGAAAVAARLMPISDGSDMAGSIRIPSAFNNIIGLRPTPGCVPTFPNDAPWSPLAVQGPLARTVDDIALMMKVMSGQDLRAPLSYSLPNDYWNFQRRKNLKGMRIAYSTDFGGLCEVDAEITKAVLDTVEVMRNLGADVVEALPDFSGAEKVFKYWRAWEFVQAFGDFYRERRSDLKSAIVHNIELGFGLTIEDLGEASKLHSQLHHNTFGFFTEFDALIVPATPVLPFDVTLEYPHTPRDGDYPSYLEWMSTCYLVTAAGNPSLAMPASLSSTGLPRGIQIVGQHKNDAHVLSIGYALEQATHFVSKNAPHI